MIASNLAARQSHSGQVELYEGLCTPMHLYQAGQADEACIRPRAFAVLLLGLLDGAFGGGSLLRLPALAAQFVPVLRLGGRKMNVS